MSAMSLPRIPSRRQCASVPRKSERHFPKLSFTYTTGAPARRARRLSVAIAFAAASARGSIASASSKSKALIMSMINSATRHSSGALPCRSRVSPGFLALERGIERGGESGFAAHDRVPGEFVTLARALRHELEPVGRDREHVGLSLHADLALERLVELGGHRLLRGIPQGPEQFDERRELVVRVQAARIRQHPDLGPLESFALTSDLRLFDRKSLAVRTHAEKGDGFRAVAPQLGRDAFASGDELGGVELLGRGGAAVDEVGDTVAALEQLVLLGRVE